MANALISASVYRHIVSFHIPYIKLLQSKGYQVYAISNEDYGNNKEQLMDLNVKCIDIPFNRNPLSLENYIAYKGIIELFKRIQFDIVHVHTPIASFLTRIARKYTPESKMIYTVHGFHFFRGAPLKNWLLYFPLELINIKNTDTLITTNNEDTIIAKKMGFRNDKVVHIKGVGVDINIDSLTVKEKKELRQSLNIDDDQCVISYVAELNDNKNHMFLLKNWNEIKAAAPNGHLLIIGAGPNQPIYEEYILENQLQDIHFLGYRKDVDKLLQISDIITLLSHREGLPKSIMEGMANGLPSVVTNTRGLTDLINHEVNGYVVNKGDDKNLIRYFVELINDETLRRKLGENSRLLVKDFSLDSVVKDYEKVYDSI